MPAPRRYVPSSTRPSGRLRGVRWQRSSRSTGMNNCVETARPDSGPWAGLLAVRDSKNASGPALVFAPAAWEGFIDALR
ncbi:MULTISPECIES: DUF397 domain-containing protein [Streptomyces]|jgi:hypothetical protein|uniref:DUF397 domain-containing protein n=1 Tax=Streptomyces ortus TaxID=2867268 RepID=A0ABT3UUG7_9ACTN|nr:MULTISPECIES: DUF397 domain-containing protein [Streptomyces]MCX4231203.1 DUF397 domain-containing protein [Streptomyces ortus]